MKANELRIGNLVNYIHSIKEYSEVVGLDEEYVYLNEITVDYVYYDEIKPIPLTEEWLIKLRFVEKSKWTFIKTMPIGLKMIYQLGTKSVHVGINGYGTGDMPCKYVHQLQNLYFAITGKELETK